MGVSISVITPTYNRAILLERCYKSLCDQDFKNFEWIIIDDGSEDSTSETVTRFLKEDKINIQYIRKENGGKPSAHNVGVKAASGELTVCLDSDDSFPKDSLKKVWTYWCANQNENSIGIIGKRGTLEGNALCSNFPSDVQSVSMYDLNNKFGFSGDTVLFFKSSVLKKCLFPVFNNEKFMPESAIYYVLDQYGKMLIMDDILYIGEYQSDGLTSKYHRLLAQNPVGTTYVYFLTAQKSTRLHCRVKYIVLTMAYWEKKCSQYIRLPSSYFLFYPFGKIYRKYKLGKLVK